MGYATLYARRSGYASRYVYPYWTYPIRSGDRYHGTGRSGGRSSEVPSTILGYARRIVPGLQGRGCPSKTNAIVDRGRSWVREMRPRVGPCSVHAPPLSSSRRPPHLSSATAPPRSCGGKGSWVYADGAPHNPSTPCRYLPPPCRLVCRSPVRCGRCEMRRGSGISAHHKAMRVGCMRERCTHSGPRSDGIVHAIAHGRAASLGPAHQAGHDSRRSAGCPASPHVRHKRCEPPVD
jgi:hypothetical protein